MQLTGIVNNFGIAASDIRPFGTGLINNTWIVVEENSPRYILQRVNTNIFKSPEAIAFNTRLIADHLAKHHPDYFFISPLLTREGQDVLKTATGYYRMFPYVKDSHTLVTVQTPGQAFEAAKAFGKFTRLLSDLDYARLKITLPHFHNLSLRFQQFQAAVQSGNKQRLLESKKLVDFIFDHKNIVDEFEHIRNYTGFKLRVTHHDTKISNVLFDKNDNCICVIDLDTVMPGYFISDVGDMMRTYLSPAGEEENDLSKIQARREFYDAIVNGYTNEMADELTETETHHFLYAGKFMIFMQAIRFLTDHLNNDIYYGAKYEGQNFVRAGNQVKLLEELFKL